jgi:urease alpha subunit
MPAGIDRPIGAGLSGPTLCESLHRGDTGTAPRSNPTRPSVAMRFGGGKVIRGAIGQSPAAHDPSPP